MATKVLGAYTRLIGYDLLRETLVPPISYIIQSKMRYEMDPNKISSIEEQQQNLENTVKSSTIIIEAIIKSIDTMPYQFRQICHAIREAVQDKFPGSEPAVEAAVGGFMILRFFNPAVVGPHTQGIISDKPPGETTRGLILISKVVQNLVRVIPRHG